MAGVHILRVEAFTGALRTYCAWSHVYIFISCWKAAAHALNGGWIIEHPVHSSQVGVSAYFLSYCQSFIVRQGPITIHTMFFKRNVNICWIVPGFVIIIQRFYRQSCAEACYDWRLGSNPWVREDPLEMGMAMHSSVLAQNIPWTEETGGLQSPGSQRVRHGWAERAHKELTEVCHFNGISLSSPSCLYFNINIYSTCYFLCSGPNKMMLLV